RTHSPGRSPRAAASRDPPRRLRGPCHGGATGGEGRWRRAEASYRDLRGGRGRRHGLDPVEHGGQDMLQEFVRLARCAADVGRRLALLRADGDLQGFERRVAGDRKSTRLTPVTVAYRMPSSA